jgi:hypothetical protein
MATLPNDKIGDHARSFFQCSYFYIRMCSGHPTMVFFDPTSSNNSHFQIERSIRTFFYHIPSDSSYDQFNGNFEAYFTHSMSTEFSSQSSHGRHCYRAVEGQDTCGGHCYTHQVYVSMPIMLCVSHPSGSTDHRWNLPLILHPFKEADLPDSTSIQYHLVARIFGDGHHFVARLTQDNKVFHYDDLSNSGSLIEIPDGTCNTHLVGLDQDLIPDWSTHYALYHLQGGKHAQSLITSHQIASIKKNFHLSVIQSHPGALPLVDVESDSSFEQMLPTACWWRANPKATKEHEFILKGHTPTRRTMQELEADSEYHQSFPSTPVIVEESETGKELLSPLLKAQSMYSLLFFMKKLDIHIISS